MIARAFAADERAMTVGAKIPGMMLWTRGVILAVVFLAAAYLSLVRLDNT